MKTILFPLAEHIPATHALAMAAHLARNLEAALTCFFVRTDPRSAIPFMGEALTADAIQDLCRAAEEEAQEMAVRAKVRAEEIVAAHGISLHWVETVGSLEDHVGRRARLADLTVVANPGRQDERIRADILREVLFRSGRPLLVVPEKAPPAMPNHSVVAWNGRAEGARALSAALPLLKRSQKVTILTVGDLHPDRPDATLAAEYLQHYGIQAELVHADHSERDVGPHILLICQHMQADCLVMGAYSHSRWREMIMGGVTRHIMAHATLPLFISH